MVTCGGLRTLALIACALHFVAVLVTSSVALCVGNDGHASYELVEDACCGEAAAVAPSPACCEGCEPLPSERIVAAPDCGGCADALVPLPGGFHLDVNVPIPALVEAGTVEPESRFAEVEIVIAARESAEAIAPVSLPLRC